MVALPLFKLGSLFVKHISKYGANRIKKQAHDHPQFRRYAARYGQYIHQINMRFSVAVLRDFNKEQRLKEKAEAPTVKTEEQTRAEEAAKEKGEQKKHKSSSTSSSTSSVWTRKFRPLPENKAVDLFADVLGDAFILGIGVALLLWETMRSKKPDSNAELIKEMQVLIEADKKRIEELETVEKDQERRVETLEQALDEMRKQTQKKRSLSIFS